MLESLTFKGRRRNIRSKGLKDATIKNWKRWGGGDWVQMHDEYESNKDDRWLTSSDMMLGHLN